jgi:hypothetical protein
VRLQTGRDRAAVREAAARPGAGRIAEVGPRLGGRRPGRRAEALCAS